MCQRYGATVTPRGGVQLRRGAPSHLKHRGRQVLVRESERGGCLRPDLRSAQAVVLHSAGYERDRLSIGPTPRTYTRTRNGPAGRRWLGQTGLTRPWGATTFSMTGAFAARTSMSRQRSSPAHLAATLCVRTTG
jgi:hypothetical protein